MTWTIGREAIRELTDRLDDLPAHLARQEAVFRRPDMVEAAANASAGLLGPEALKTAIERLRRNPEIERLEPKKPTAESLAGMAHTEIYSTRHNLRLEQAVKNMTAAMAADTRHGLPEEAVREKVKTLLEQGYPLSQEQSLAIRHATVRLAAVAVIEGAAGSGKTTTLRPITDLHKEHGYEIVPTAVAWRTAVTARRRLRRACLLRRQAAEACGQGAGGDWRQDLDRGGRGGDAVDAAGPPHPTALRAPRGEGGVRRRHSPAAAGGGGARFAAHPRCRPQRPGRPHQAPEGGPGGRAGPRPQGDAGAGEVPGRSHEPAGARRHPRRLRGHGPQTRVHAVAGGSLGSAQGRGGGEGHRGVASAQPASPLPRRGEDAYPLGGRLGAPCARTARHVHRRARAHEGGGPGAVVADARARAQRDPRREARRHRGEPGPGRQGDRAAGDRGG